MGLLGVFGIISCIKELWEEANIKAPPPNSRYDYEAYWKDIRENVPLKERQRKERNNEYYTTKPVTPPLPIDAIVDVEHYEYDKEHRGEYIAELRRKNGWYRTKKDRSRW